MGGVGKEGGGLKHVETSASQQTQTGAASKGAGAQLSYVCSRFEIYQNTVSNVRSNEKP